MGSAVGSAEAGITVGARVGGATGFFVGVFVGFLVGAIIVVGTLVGFLVGVIIVGTLVGFLVGAIIVVGALVGFFVGFMACLDLSRNMSRNMLCDDEPNDLSNTPRTFEAATTSRRRHEIRTFFILNVVMKSFRKWFDKTSITRLQR